MLFIYCIFQEKYENSDFINLFNAEGILFFSFYKLYLFKELMKIYL